jgi:hypothetical protein
MKGLHAVGGVSITGGVAGQRQPTYRRLVVAIDVTEKRTDPVGGITDASSVRKRELTPVATL